MADEAVAACLYAEPAYCPVLLGDAGAEKLPAAVALVVATTPPVPWSTGTTEV